MFGIKRKPALLAVPVETKEDLRLRKEAEENARQWVRSLKNSPQSYLLSYLKDAGLPEDVSKILGRTCIFWLKDDRLGYGQVYAARIDGINTFGPSLWMQLSINRNNEKPMELIHSGGWRVARGFSESEKSILGFQLV